MDKDIEQMTEIMKVLLKPSNFVKNFKSNQEFREWLETGSVEDLEFTLKAFEHDEAYEYCPLILEVIKEKNGHS